LFAEILRVVGTEVRTPSGADQERIASLDVHPLRLHRLVQVARGDLESGRQRVRPARRHVTRHIEEHRAVDHEVGWKGLDPEIRADAARRGRRGDRVHAAEELQIPAGGGRACAAAGPAMATVPATLAAAVSHSRRDTVPIRSSLASGFANPAPGGRPTDTRSRYRTQPPTTAHAPSPLAWRAAPR